MMISRRTKTGWRRYKNKSKTRCDVCGNKLWIGPSRMVYCNSYTHAKK